MTKATIVWDGDCGFCQFSVQRLMGRRGASALFESIPRQSLSVPPWDQATLDRAGHEVLLVDSNGRIRGGADAVFEILARTGWGFFARFLAAPPLIWLFRVGYRLVASNRGWISQKFFGGQSCQLPRRP